MITEGGSRLAGPVMPVSEKWARAIGDLWQTQSQWSKEAGAHKGARQSWTGPLVLLGLLGVVLSTLTPRLVQHFAAASGGGRNTMQALARVVGPFLVAISAALTREMLGPKAEQQWVQARRVAEALKAEGYIYLTGAPPYVEIPTAPERLAEKVEQLVDGGAGPLPEADPDVATKHPHQPMSVDSYIDDRVRGQVSYYEREARRHCRRLRNWQRVALVLSVSLAALGVFAGVGKDVSFNAWVAVISTAIATVTAFIYAERFEFFAATYWVAARKLANRVKVWDASSDRGEGAAGRFVLDCEAILAGQNEAWARELTRRVHEEMREGERRRKGASSGQAA